MPTLTSASTDAQVEAEYDDTASYAEDLSVAKARRFVTACRILVRRYESSMTKGANALSKRVDLLRDELKDAQAWLEARSADDGMGDSIILVQFEEPGGRE